MDIKALLKESKDFDKKQKALEKEMENFEKERKKANRKTSPFQFIEAIQTKDYILSEKNAKHYNPYIVNMGLSQHVENIGQAFNASILQAELAGLHSEFANRLQFDYLFHSIRKGKKFGKWAKVEKYEHLDLIMEIYKVNRDQAISILNRLNEEEIDQLVEWSETKSGGLTRN